MSLINNRQHIASSPLIITLSRSKQKSIVIEYVCAFGKLRHLRSGIVQLFFLFIEYILCCYFYLDHIFSYDHKISYLSSFNWRSRKFHTRSKIKFRPFYLCLSSTVHNVSHPLHSLSRSRCPLSLLICLNKNSQLLNLCVLSENYGAYVRVLFICSSFYRNKQ